MNILKNFLRMFGTTKTYNSTFKKSCRTVKRKTKCTCYKNGRLMSCRKHPFRDLNKQMSFRNNFL